MAQVQSQMSSRNIANDARFRDMYQGIEKGSMAYKMMSSMGWKEGEGLGANKQGISVHVKAHKKFDTAGVGLKESSARAQDWTLEMCKFSGILQGLQEVVNTSVADATANDSDDRPDKSRKSKRRKKQIKPDSDDSTDTSETAERSSKPSFVPAAAGKAAAPKLTSHAGRYAKRTRNKLVKGYSQVDLAAILGQATGQETPHVLEVSKQPKASEIRPSVSATERPQPCADDKQASSAFQGTPQASTKQATPADASEPSWWASGFARRATMGTPGSGWDQEKAFQNKAGFSEQDQTDLYNNAQDGKTQGKRGLGIGGRAGELKRRAWTGKKSRFDSDVEDNQVDSVEDTEARMAAVEAEVQDPNSDMLPGGAVIVWAHGVRPDWFVQRRSVLHAGRSEAGGAAVGTRECGTAGHAATPHAGGQVKLTQKQRERCLRVVSKMLRKRGGEVKLADAADKVLAALHLDKGSDLIRLRKKVRSALRQADAWTIDDGIMRVAV